jgi:hypothetical protein
VIQRCVHHRFARCFRRLDAPTDARPGASSGWPVPARVAAAVTILAVSAENRLWARRKRRGIAVGGPLARLRLSLRLAATVRSERRRLRRMAAGFLMRAGLDMPVTGLTRATTRDGSDILTLAGGSAVFLSPPDAPGLSLLDGQLAAGGVRLLSARPVTARLMLLRFIAAGGDAVLHVAPRHVSVLHPVLPVPTL